MKTINLSILDFKKVWASACVELNTAINLSILDFKKKNYKKAT